MADDFTTPRSAHENADVRKASGVEQADVQLGETMASNRHHPLVKAAGDASKIGDQGPLYAISAAVLIAGIGSKNRRLASSGFSMLAAVAVADLAKSLTKRLVRRTRPHVFLDEGRYETDAGGSPRKPEQSFPSGHTAASVAAARALSRDYPGPGAAAGVAAVAIGISRIAKGAHWPLDVAGGAAVGLIAEELSLQALRGLVAGAAALTKRSV
ncbi:MAG: phosphatase PAP2 family protein [Verrucomicrobiota bacterium]|nr:phosphatase PAP2 family protein [Verrucomicrobiota bacterium]